MRRGFTLIELMVVVAMIAVIMAAMTTGVVSAQRRARVSRAEAEARELTNAILAYQNYDEDGSLAKFTMEDAEATEGKLGFVLGQATARGQKVPVLYNAATIGGKLVDPWGTPYRITIKKGATINPPGVPSMNIRMFYPNWHRPTGGGQ